MSVLYNQLARVYHNLYQNIFDYAAEAAMYASQMKTAGCRTVVELGCGSGCLVRHLEAAGFNYTGVDLSSEMLAIARENHPHGRFIQGDMRAIPLGGLFDAVLITGRAFTYMKQNCDALACLRSVNRILRNGGLLAFDNFNAGGLFRDFKGEMTYEDTVEGVCYRRISRNTPNLATGWTWDWHAEYYQVNSEGSNFIAGEESTLRAFTQDELTLLLELSGFKVESVLPDGVIFTFFARKFTNPIDFVSL